MVKTGGSKSLTYSWSEDKGYLRRGKKIGYERFESVRSELFS
jgi:hypothetical protein